MQSTVILVHGAFAESSSWHDVAARLAPDHRVVAYANPLRGIASDAAGLTALVRSVDGPVVLAGHSYGGAVLSNVDPSANIVGLVYVAAFALEAGESPGQAASLVPGGTLGETLQPVPLVGGGTDLYITQDRYHAQFCADVADAEAKLLAMTQRPITEAALSEPSGDPLWRSVPSWFVFGDEDRNIPVGAHRLMAERAGSKRTIEVPGASHVVGLTHPDTTAELIAEAARVAQPVS
jgi:pimeloyl-ACP methyl ester carboxylesterase